MNKTPLRRILEGALALGLVGFLSRAAVAQVPAQTLPPYAQPSSEQTIRGRITAIKGTFDIAVRDDKGFIDSVELHRGTIINPTGLTLAAGMRVKILGYSAGNVFEANEIDTPYTYAGPPPPPAYYGPGWWYPGYEYGWGPAFGLRVHIGGSHPTVQRGAFPHGRPITQPPFPRRAVGAPYRGVPGRR